MPRTKRCGQPTIRGDLSGKMGGLPYHPSSLTELQRSFSKSWRCVSIPSLHVVQTPSKIRLWEGFLRAEPYSSITQEADMLNKRIRNSHN